MFKNKTIFWTEINSKTGIVVHVNYYKSDVRAMQSRRHIETISSSPDKAIVVIRLKS